MIGRARRARDVEAAEQADAGDRPDGGQHADEGQQRQQVPSEHERLAGEKVVVEQRKGDCHRPSHAPGPADGTDGAQTEPAEEEQKRRPLHAAREVLVVGEPRRLRQTLRRVVPSQVRVAVEERPADPGSCTERRSRNAAAAPPSTASEAARRDGLVPSVIHNAMSGTMRTRRAGVFRRRREARGRAGPSEAGRALPFVGDKRQQQRERHEKRDRHVGQHVVRFAHVQRHDCHQARRERGVSRAPSHPDAVHEQHRERAEERRDGASPEIEVRRRRPGRARSTRPSVAPARKRSTATPSCT